LNLNCCKAKLVHVFELKLL